MESNKRRLSPLAEVELDALEAGREWTRHRIEKKLQRLADKQGAISPPERSDASAQTADKASVDDECGRGGD